MKDASIGPFLGVDNRLPDFGLRLDAKQRSGNYLRSAENVDIDNVGNLRTRESELLIAAMTGAHSLRMVGDATGYLVRDSILYSIQLPIYSESLLKSLTSNAPVSWLEFAGDTYYSNGTDSGRISGGVVYPLGLPTPAQPTVSAIAGTLFAGAYQVALSYVNNATGEESGASPKGNIVLSAAGGLRVLLPSVPTGATHTNVYVSSVNGSVPMLAATVTDGTALLDIATTPTQGRVSSERYEEPLPDGTLFSSNGRLCSFNGSTVYVGLPFRPGYYLPTEGYIPFIADVTLAIENQGGTFIAADKTYWIPGDIGNVEGALATVLPYGAVQGTAFSNPSNSDVGWFGDDGFVIGKTSGEVATPMADRIDQPTPDSGASIVRSSNGYLRVFSCGWCMNFESGAATSYAGYEFNSFSGDYGLKEDGVYALSGGAGVDAIVDFGKLNFKTDSLKHITAAYLGVISSDAIGLTVALPSGESYDYLARSSDDALKIQRVDTGRGLRANWFNISISNPGGSEFSLASVSFNHSVSSRRI